LALALDNSELRARLTLRPEVRLQDGSVLKAAEVAASLMRALASPAGWTLAPIVSARALGDDVVELQLARPAPDLPLLLSTPAAMVAKSGPFAVDKLDHGGVALKAFGEHFAGRPYLDKLLLNSF